MCRLLQNENKSRTTGTGGGEKEIIYYYKIDEKNVFYQQISIFEQGTFPRIQDQIVKFQYEVKTLLMLCELQSYVQAMCLDMEKYGKK